MRYILLLIVCSAGIMFNAQAQKKMKRYDTLSIPSLEKEITVTAQPLRSILYSLLASKYYDYYQNNRWKLYDRTTTVDFKKEDIATWSMADFHEKISALYIESIREKKLLQQTSLTPYDSLIIKGNVRHLRPTLYDLLTNRALDYFSNDERNITKPAYAFEIRDEAAFAPAASFAQHHFTTRDTSSLEYKALLLYQELIAFHLKDQTPDALIDVDLNRIGFMQQKAILNNKDQLYYNALQNIASTYDQLPVAAQAWYLMAEWHAGKAASYDPIKDTANRYAYLEAKKICEKILLQKQNSEGKTNCANLLTRIHAKELTMNTEKINVPDKPFRTLVHYRNYTQLYFRLIRLTDQQRINIVHRYDNDYWKQLVQLPSIRSWSQQLPATNDYQPHAAEIKVDALPVGSYALLASVQSNFGLDKNPLAIQYFYVSNISFVNADNDYFVLHRETGKPLAKAAVQVWNNYYDYTSRKNINNKAFALQTDNNGYFRLRDRKNNEREFRIEISYGKDRLFLDESYYVPYRGENEDDTKLTAAAYEKEKAKVFLFTDRKIYRPGQTVYFKGIAITKDFQTKQNKIVVNTKTKVFLHNANREEIDSLELTTNEYGSYSGKFTLPTSGLNGSFSIEDENFDNAVDFSVEEYKRPTFYVEYEPLKGTYRVNDSIVVKGFAKAYAGNNIDGATVTYRVTRNPRFIYPWLFRKIGWPRSSSMEITNGTVTTDKDGNFSIRFKAIPDETLDKTLDPVFDYEITADIADVNGETRSGSTRVSVSYKALQLNIVLPANASVAKDSLRSLTIRTQNINGIFETAKVQVQIYPLQDPGRLIRNRYWQQPDQFVMSREEYIALFPYDEYSDETSKENWTKGTKVIDVTDTSSISGKYPLPATKLKVGWHVIEASTKDKNGEEVKDVQYILLEDEQSKAVPAKTYLTSVLNKTSIEPGEKATVTIGSSANDVFLIQSVNKKTDTKKEQQSSFNFLTLNNEKKSFDFSATEADRGGYNVSYLFVKNNRFYSSSNNINVPWTNKELSVNYQTWRDKTLPGSEEQWSVQISGYKKEKLAAEMLASMYDASLDQIAGSVYQWNTPAIWSSNYFYNNWNGRQNFEQIGSQNKYINEDMKIFEKNYDVLKYSSNYRRLEFAKAAAAPALTLADGVVTTINQAGTKDEGVVYESQSATGAIVTTQKVQEPEKLPLEEVTIRKNFNETAFFFPHLTTDANGNINFNFTMPEALTRWKFQTLAHTKDLAFGYTTTSVVTQKKLMLQPNVPRFLREGDQINLSTRVVNMSDKEMTGTVQLELLNAATMQPIGGWFQNRMPQQFFTIAAGQSTAIDFGIDIPYNYNNAVVYRFKAVGKATDGTDASQTSDGEEAAIPVLSNNMLVTESLPLNMRGTGSKTFTFDKLLQSGKSETLQQYGITVEYTSNPAWYAVQALPYLTEFPYECAEQTFNRYYANALAAMIAGKTPKLKAIVERWNSTDTSALLSNLQKNQELKAVLLEETPWILDAKNEAQQKKNIAILFDMVRMNAALGSSFEKLKQTQSSNGGFVWFKGGPDNRYITQYIVTGVGHLAKLGALNSKTTRQWNAITSKAIPYLDDRLIEDYNQLKKSKADLTKNQLSYIAVQYLYMRSFFLQTGIPAKAMEAVTFYRKQAVKYWKEQNNYTKGMIALALYRTGDIQTANTIMQSLKQAATVDNEMGMYWKDVTPGYYWYQAPVETQSLLIEAFSEITKNNKTVDDLKTWLLKQKQTQNWKTTKATAEACYALLLQGSDWLNNNPAVTIQLGDKTINSNDQKQEAGTGYFKKRFDEAFVNPEMGNIKVTIQSQQPTGASTSWGAVYWQYFEQLDKIKPAATPLQLSKKLFVEKNTDRGPVLQPINDDGKLKVGDKVKVRIELRVDRDMEYVHMKDMRASCLEPVNVLSSYKWQGGLGYYESTRDASTNFFFDYLRKGTYVFEYPLFVTHAGEFSNGVTSIQCMYAPEFSSHSEGIRINVAEKQ